MGCLPIPFISLVAKNTGIFHLAHVPRADAFFSMHRTSLRAHPALAAILQQCLAASKCLHMHAKTGVFASPSGHRPYMSYSRPSLSGLLLAQAMSTQTAQAPSFLPSKSDSIPNLSSSAGPMHCYQVASCSLNLPVSS